ncbi:MAG: helix-turn-helix domain-containing protein [Anaerostipes sp.]
MAVSYKRLSHILIERNMSYAQLQRLVGYSANITTRLKKNKYVSMETIENICNELDCGVDDILEFELENKGEEKDGE